MKALETPARLRVVAGTGTAEHEFGLRELQLESLEQFMLSLEDREGLIAIALERGLRNFLNEHGIRLSRSTSGVGQTLLFEVDPDVPQAAAAPTPYATVDLADGRKLEKFVLPNGKVLFLQWGPDTAGHD